MNPMDLQDLDPLAQELYAARVEMQEIARVVAFLRKRVAGGDGVGAELDVFLERMSHSAGSFFASAETYMKIQAAKAAHLSEITDGRLLFLAFDGALAIMRSYREVPSLVKRDEKERPKQEERKPQEKKKEDRTRYSPFAVLKAQAQAQAVAVVESPPVLKRGERVVALVTGEEGTLCVADFNGITVKFNKPLYGAPETGERVELELQSEQKDFWRGLFRRIKA